MKHPQETRDKALTLYRSGLSVSDTAAEVGIKVATVGGWVRSSGIARPQGARVGPRADRDLRRPVLDDLYSSGDSFATVAKRHGVSPSALRSWCHEDGGRREDDQSDVAFTGEWVRDGLILRPAIPARTTRAA